MQTQCAVNSVALNGYWDDMVIDMTATWVASLFYAFYLNLFSISLHTLIRRKTAAKGMLLGFTCTMAVLGTAQMVVRVAIITVVARSLPQFIEEMQVDANPGPTPKPLRTAQLVLCVINNIVAESLFLYRCYMIWGSRKKVLIVPGFLMVSTFVLGGLAIKAPDSWTSPFEVAPYVIATATNLVLMLLTAGRIWWIRRQALIVGADDTIRSRYSSVIAMIVESGALYCATTILLAITYFLPGNSFLMLQAAAMHLVNIAPTIIVVRVGLGYENTTGSSPRQHTLRFPARQALDGSHSQASALHIKHSGDDVDF
ncbi:hypothetical protein C8R47DRAFT_537007 [Mycena vitilis]|nr:hypothetical protein C8R47DRAFT_537007 [Mycena vitilis]